MTVKVLRSDPAAKLPAYAHPGDAGMDVRSVEDVTLAPGARALVRRPGLLVLDEVTNHLDADARAAFGKLIRKLAPGRIVLVVSHDPAMIDLCDEKIFCQIMN